MEHSSSPISPPTAIYKPGPAIHIPADSDIVVMASSYALPTSFPPSHGPGHMRTGSYSTNPFQSLNSISAASSSRMEVSQPRNEGVCPSQTHGHQDHHNKPLGCSNDHDDEHSYSPTHDHSHKHEPNNIRPHIQRSRASMLPPLQKNGWTRTSSISGKQMITPTHAVKGKIYEAPSPTGVTHNHSSPERSRFTTFLLRYTMRWPWLHAIVIEKDSRRIFYFMT